MLLRAAMPSPATGIGWCLAPLLTLMGSGVATTQDQRAQDPTTRTGTVVRSSETDLKCSETPPVGRALVRARQTGRGILATRLDDPATSAVAVGGGPCSDENTPRGRAAAAVGALLYDDQPHCSAVLVHPTMAITAAHCVRGFDDKLMKFVIGVDPERPVQSTTVYAMSPHDEYDAGVLGVNDVGYVHLDHAIEAPSVTRYPVSLPQLVPKDPKNRRLLYVGYGIAGRQAGKRRCVSIEIHDVCERRFSYKDPRRNTCHGDSGGGVFLDDDGQLSLVGVTLWGDTACQAYGVSADVGAFHEWINARKSGGLASAPPAPKLKIPMLAPRGVQVAIVAAVALKRITDRNGNKQTLWAPTGFIGYEPLKNRRLAFGVAIGGGFATNTPSGIVIAGTARGDVYKRLGLIVGHGIRVAPDDRLRHAWGIGLTVRMWNLTPRWE